MPLLLLDKQWVTEWRTSTLNRKTVTEYRFTGDPKKDLSTLNHIREESQAIILKKDSTKAIHVTLTDDMTYGTYVFLLNTCNKDGIASYGGLDNDFWLVPVLPPPPIDTSAAYVPICGTKNYENAERNKELATAEEQELIQSRDETNERGSKTTDISIVTLWIACRHSINLHR